jgi:sec-independent protein translocase protein TatA
MTCAAPDMVIRGGFCVSLSAFVVEVFPTASEFLKRGNFMIEGLMQPMHLIVILGIALLVFGPKKLPELGKGLGEGIRGFRGAMAQAPENKDANKTEA